VQEVKAISVLPEHACRWEAYPGIKVIPLKGDRWKRSVGLITPQLAAPLPAVSCFVDFLRLTAEKFYSFNVLLFILTREIPPASGKTILTTFFSSIVTSTRLENGEPRSREE
jgi:hypothetical protein